MTDLEDFPRVGLMQVPTPLVRLERLGAELGTDLWIKRDDLGETGLGGNKLRKLEFLVGDALAVGCDTLVTFGAVQSNHVRQTAAAAARCGIHCHAILTRTVPRHDDLYAGGGNRLLDDLFGATVHTCDPDDLDEAVADVEAALSAAGARARWIAPGGSEPTGVLGYVVAGRELMGQARPTNMIRQGMPARQFTIEDARISVGSSRSGTERYPPGIIRSVRSSLGRYKQVKLACIC